MTKKNILLALVSLVIIFYKKLFVIGCIVIGAIFFPEASKIVRHYCFGDGTDLIVSSNYIKTSPVIKKHLSKMKIGQKHKVGMKQREDWRLSFAINGFTIEKQKHKIIVSQWIQFDTTGKVKTWLYLIPVSDAIVHTFKCTPFMFRSEWDY
ncbi:MAG: hypothetical protein K9I82_08010 [Chitinophagaceae bacterium]|nr:hypothetical protein [Chitinophagaceae bacterium]